jgi:hypothetical protein
VFRKNSLIAIACAALGVAILAVLHQRNSGTAESELVVVSPSQVKTAGSILQDPVFVVGEICFFLGKKSTQSF